jgi:hypothetical protein
MINDLKHITSKYVDDTTLLEVSDNPLSTDLQTSATETYEWSRKNDMQLNESKTKEILIDFSITKFSDFTPISIDGVKIGRVNEAKLLGVIVREDLKLNLHVAAITMKAGQRIHVLAQMKRAGVSAPDIVMMYCAKIRPVL